MYEFQLPVSLTKEEMQSVADLAGQDLSMSEYLQKVIRDHIAGGSSPHAPDKAWFCPDCGVDHPDPKYQRPCGINRRVDDG